MELFNAILPELTKIAVILLTALASYLGILLNGFLEKQSILVQQNLKKEQWAMVEKIISHTVSYVEQTFKDLDGEKKLEHAKLTVLRLANEQGLEITDEQLKVITESFVNEFFGHLNDVVLVEKLEGTE